MNSAGYVSSEQVQIIWGKILSDEFKRPGSTPPCMIRVLSEMTPKLAKAFQLVCSMSVSICELDEKEEIKDSFRKIIVPFSDNNETLYSMGLGFDMLNELETLGVIRFSPVSGYISKGVSNEKMIIIIDNRVDLIEQHEKEVMPIGDVILTSVGKVLYETINASLTIEGYYDMVKAYMSKKGVVFAENHNYYVDVHDNNLEIKRKMD